ncbi:MAG: EAL domain-containing protein [Microcoleus sp. PH2017_10_PVI_O_A]|uniref:EAL domain-containing protein n=1 Tax=unclassified Microcoleus TaxID=2642155 RepID=UPI001D6FD57D|nr:MULTISPECIES: EAL domain-containing protein [unclassified Microcoleus]TAE79765.1 MAG: EAL domain-containing protein [Oscillatoriales cyanobacterium]MCC3408053.1 EAL domain-containing protein [Microcoleus sp. PH2017_10_PVI_O_A]MCC3462173.1 EAL domain-containing protein [Microcoleus sp. PH2017_11_PCY_U_A]MCC3480605.1 EAL domain-containing protein [Microcoleus sp. PH2017_12_PCY_D_A]MCC3530569.1 EAL domain-containing protein [Microcoleus sp. PH2017_21_RUC_O_A]
MLDRTQTNYLLKTVSESTLKLLIVEDMAEDLELIVLALEAGGVNFKYDTAETATECRQLLHNCKYDAVLSDYRLPGFNGLEVLKLMQEIGQEIPFILVTGSLGEEAAVECIKAGMNDFVLKGRLFRLPTVLERSLQEYKMRRQQQFAIAQIQRQATREAIVNRIVQAMRFTLVLDEVLQTTADQLHEALEISACAILQPDAEGNIIVRYISSSADKQQLVGLNCELAQHYRCSLAAGEILALDELSSLCEELQASAKSIGFSAVAIAPLLYQQSFLGGIGLYECDRARSWSAEELSLLKAIADQCAIAIHQAELYQQASKELAERKRAEAEVRGIQQQLATMAANIPGSVYRALLHPDGKMSMPYISPGVREVTGIAPEEVMARPELLTQIIHPEDKSSFDSSVAASSASLLPCDRQYRIVLNSGEVKWVQDSARFSKNENGDVIVDGVALDISDRKQAESALRQSEQRFRSLIENATDITIILDAEGIFRYISPSVKRILGYAPHQAIGRSALGTVHPDDCAAIAQTLHKAIENPKRSQCPLEYRVLHRNGSWCYVEAVATNLLHDPAVNGIVINCHDITQRKKAEEQLLHDAFHDALTGLPNRALFTDRLEHALRLAKRRKDYLFAVLFLDLDRFKVVNDSLGHAIGDRLLVAIAQRLTACLRVGDTVARLGGDEFVLLLEDIDGVNEADSIVKRLQKTITSPILLDGHEVFITASIGIALSSGEYEEPTSLLRDADTAMYRAKELGRARHEVFNSSMHAHALRLLQLENDLRRAIESIRYAAAEDSPPSPPSGLPPLSPTPQFIIHYQPIVSIANNAIIGFEALVRWQHPERGLVSPNEFIPIAEETGSIVPLGRWVLRTACHQIRQWQQLFQNNPPLSVSVNLSVKQFSQPDLIEYIDRVLEETHLEGSSLKLEITESVLIENSESVTAMLVQLRARNIHLCIDDFGTGYSSLSYLHRFPTNTLKIDRSFVSRMGGDFELGKGGIDPTEIVRSIVTLSHNLGMDVVAEGVEEASQLSILKGLKCEFAQGFFFSKPVDSQTAADLIRHQAENQNLLTFSLLEKSS